MRHPSFYRSAATAVALALILSQGVSSWGIARASYLEQITEIPKESDWVDRGVVLRSGHHGEWDAKLGGMISPSTVIKREGIYFLYYIGADGERAADGGSRHRSLGVATSRDGIHFEKYSGNPIVTFLPNKNEEEGVFSAGGTLDAGRNIVLYYGAMNAGSVDSTSVRSDVRLAVSHNGFDFRDVGVVLSHRDASVWGYGDELFPVGAFRERGRWHVYYIAKSGKRSASDMSDRRPTYWDVGLASGISPQKLPDTKPVLASGSHVIGGGDPVALGEDKIALFVVRNFGKRTIEVRIASSRQPDRLSEPVRIYRFRSLRHATIFLDRGARTWLMYFVDGATSAIKLRTAPVRN